jgi:transketolase
MAARPAPITNTSAAAAAAPVHPAELDRVVVNTIKTLAMDAVQKANSGHPGLPMGAADYAYVLWTRFLKHHPGDPEWPDRDRFVLSAGHGCMLLYALLHLAGYDLSLEDIKRFRQWKSRTPGHPESHLTPGVEATTGPLGQGFGNGVGMALAERMLAARFNTDGHTVVDHFTYGIVSDGDIMEGVQAEAASIAGHLGLGKLIYFYDDNHITIDGPTELAISEDVGARFKAYGWHVQRIGGHDLPAIAQAIEAARAETSRPSLIIGRTHIAHGSPNKQDTAEAHGAPLGEEEVRLTKLNLGWPPDAKFEVPVAVTQFFADRRRESQEAHEEWTDRFAAYRRGHPERAAEFERCLARELPADWERDLPQFKPGGKGMATRVASHQVMQAIARRVPEFVGGSADLASSNRTSLDGHGSVTAGHYDGRNIHFGVREHGMGAILNGLALHRGFHVFGATFLTFSDYMRPSIRLAALTGLPVTYVFTHDSIFLGEDGPTHQPIEHLASLRAMPNLTVIRPADADEVVEGWRIAMTNSGGPVALVLSRQDLPILDRKRLAPASGLKRGAYVLREAEGGASGAQKGAAEADSGLPELILLGSGSEVHLLVEAADKLAGEKLRVRVVSFPSWELFETQPEDYRRQVLPLQVTARLAVEAGSRFGWERYVGPHGHIHGIDHYGASAPAKALASEFGFTVERIIELAREVLKKARG